MSWIYEQSTGNLSHNGVRIGQGYSGAGAGKNNASMQADIDMGPIPCGVYSIETPVNSIEHGPFAMPLLPAATNEMFGRSGFMLHGDSIAHPGDASEGCVIMARSIREYVWASGDRELQVVPGPA